MGAFEAILVLTLVGFLLLAVEVFVPGMVLGILGGLCLVGAVVTAFVGYGVLAGAVTLAGVGVLTIVGFIIWMSVFPRTFLGKKIMLSHSLAPGDGERNVPAGLLGREGSALSPLRPAGSAIVDGRKLDVVAESDFIAAGENVVVIREEGFRVVVRKKV